LTRTAKGLRGDYSEPAEGTPSAKFLKQIFDRLYIFSPISRIGHFVKITQYC